MLHCMYGDDLESVLSIHIFGLIYLKSTVEEGGFMFDLMTRKTENSMLNMLIIY